MWFFLLFNFLLPLLSQDFHAAIQYRKKNIKKKMVIKLCVCVNSINNRVFKL